MKKVNKIIKIEFCDDCPLNGKCHAWKALKSHDRVRLIIGNGIAGFILKNCHLEDGPDL